MSQGRGLMLLWSWLGYPGRMLFAFALVSGLLSGGSFLALDWSRRAEDLRRQLQADMERVLASEQRLSAHILVRHPRIARAQSVENDGAFSPLRQQESLAPWLPVDEWVQPTLSGEVRLASLPITATEAPGWIARHLLPPLGLGLLLALLIAPFHGRPTRHLQAWVQALDQGRLGQSAPHLPWPIHRTAEQLRVVAERLRHTRAALLERQSSADRQYRQQIRELQTELAKFRQEQETQSSTGDARGELLRTMSHEMRTPLTAIIGYADLLGRNDPSPEVAEYSGVISRSARNLLGMINNLLDLARIEAGALQMQVSTFDISELVEDTVALLAPLAFDKSLELSTLIYHDVPTRLRGDPLRIAQVLTNLLSNAIKYTEQGEIIVRLLVERRDQDEVTLRMEVEDTGRGLDPDQQQKLFQAWRRFEVAGSTTGGSGLGLVIVHKLLDTLGGRIDVRSEAGRGSCFSAVVPVQLAEGRAGVRWDALRGAVVWACESHPTAARALTHMLTFWEADFRLWTHMGELYDALADPRQPHPAQIVILGLDSRGVSASAANDILTLPPSLRPPALVLVPSIDAASHRLWRERGASAVLAKASPRSSLYEKLLQLTVAEDTSAPPPLTGVSVLVADNNRTGLRILQTQLQKLGAEVTCVDSGAAALSAWEQSAFGLVLLDYHMPGLDGRACVERMRRVSGRDDAVIVGMSAWLDTVEEESWKQEGVDAVLIKPFDMDRLLRVLRQHHPGIRADQPGTGSRRTSTAPLLHDPEMTALLREELPQQWRALDEAFISGDLRQARDTAHQLHGTAAFLHLQPLQNDLALLERNLQAARNLDDEHLPDIMARVQTDVRALLSELDAAHRAE